MKNLQSIIHFLNSLNLGIYLLLGLSIFSYSYHSRSVSKQKSITVTGLAYQDVKADTAKWTIYFSQTNLDRKQSLDLLKKDETKLLDFLNKLFSNSSVYTGFYNTNPNYSRNSDGSLSSLVDSYTTTSYIVVDSQDVDLVNKTRNKLTEYATNDNINITDSQVSFIYTKLEDAKISLLENAVANAKKRAEALGKIRNTRIGKVLDAGQGVFQVNPKDNLNVTWDGNFDTSAINKTIRATVSTTFEIK